MENDFEKKMESVETPKTEFVKHQNALKIGLLNARKSAKIGFIFILLPVVLIILTYVKVAILMKADFFGNFVLFVDKERQADFTSWLIHVFLILLPIMAILINLLAISHFQIDKVNKELTITIQYRLKNIIVLIIAAIIIMIVFWYIVFLK